jgi:5-methylcytosine-specific restriction endonuclease McrA
MKAPSSEQQIAFLTNLQRLLGEGSFVATYKYALLMALADIAVERGADDDSELLITTSQIAEKFIQYYWRQSTPYLSSRVLQQNTGRQAGIISLVHTAHNQFEGSLTEARHDQRQWNQMVRKVAEIVRVMPLWKLQTVGSDKLDFLYANTGQGSQITLKSGIAFCFRKHYGLVADMVKGAWLRYVRRFNVEALGDRTDLNEFLFGSERANLKEVGKIINEFQAGTCFYCRRSLKGDASHVDHFVPWSRYPVDLGHNFVLAHATCNSKKSDRLAAAVHLDAWCEYQNRNAMPLAAEFNRHGILNDFNSTLRVVNWVYNQTFDSHGLTWLRNQELQPLDTDWSKPLKLMLN